MNLYTSLDSLIRTQNAVIQGVRARATIVAAAEEAELGLSASIA